MSKMLTIRNNTYAGEFNLPDYFQVSFELDPFQKHAIDCINRNEDVLVTAHTGSGKTIPAEYAIAKALDENQKVIYTAPIKTLSNQKYKDFSEKFGAHNIGIITGDIKNNPDAPCLIMTTEILRNILYRQNNKIETSNPFDININMEEVQAVIFDEVHYVNDRDRGTVWEESIIMLDSRINLIMLSATIDDADKFANWIGEMKEKKISLLSNSVRPVPLQHYIYTTTLHKILDSSGNFLNENFEEASKKFRKMEKERFNYKNMLISSVSHLQEKEQLPATYFVLNRKNCSVFANLLPQNLVSAEDATYSLKLFDKYLSKVKGKYEHTDQYKEIKKLLVKGIAIHHSGIIPILKEAIEMIYSEGLIKVLFATETFAAGVNMPTKTVVFTQLTKFDGKRRELHADEYKQMAGRAGRRGMDSYGTVIQLPMYEFLGKESVKNMMLGKTGSIRSKFDINYKFILKMLAIYTNTESLMENIISMAKKSYLSKQNDSLCLPVLQQLQEMETKLSNLPQFSDSELEILRKYDEVKNMIESGTQFGIKIHAKALKKHAKTLSEIELKNQSLMERYKTDYKEYLLVNEEYKKLSLDKDYYEGIFRDQIQMILNFLQDNNYVDQDFKLTPLGLIAKEINECNEIILSQVINQGFLDDLSPAEIVGLISIFIQDSSNSEEITIKGLTLPDYLENILYDIGEISEKFACQENEMVQRNNIYIFNDWNLHLDCFKSIMLWGEGNNFDKIKECYESFEGNLIKNILRVSNIVRELIGIAEMLKNHSLYKKLLSIEEILLRDEVTVESLYV